MGFILAIGWFWTLCVSTLPGFCLLGLMLGGLFLLDQKTPWTVSSRWFWPAMAFSCIAAIALNMILRLSQWTQAGRVAAIDISLEFFWNPVTYCLGILALLMLAAAGFYRWHQHKREPFLSGIAAGLILAVTLQFPVAFALGDWLVKLQNIPVVY